MQDASLQESMGSIQNCEGEKLLSIDLACGTSPQGPAEPTEGKACNTGAMAKRRW